jgi:hypothetical protein
MMIALIVELPLKSIEKMIWITIYLRSHLDFHKLVLNTELAATVQ